MFEKNEIMTAGAIKASGIDDVFISPTTDDLIGVMDNIVITSEDGNEELDNNE